MNPNHPSNDDPLLRGLLREARPATELPLGFQAAVWRQIEGRESAASVTWLERVVSYVLRPQWMIASLAVVMLAGVLLGARVTPPTGQASAQARYVASVNPFQPRP